MQSDLNPTCGKRTCAAHIDDMILKIDSYNSELKVIKCHFCEKIHHFPEDANSFPVDKHIPLFLNMDSKIVDTNQLRQELVDLCKLDGKQFQLIYRASRDGFKAKSFHTKCDGKVKTLSVAQSSDGYIFGGYTDVAWDSSGVAVLVKTTNSSKLPILFSIFKILKPFLTKKN